MLPKVSRIKEITKFEHATRSYVRGTLDDDQTKKDCVTCPQTVWISIFFDGTGNNFYEDGRFRYADEGSKQSNIAKLAFFAWPVENINKYLADSQKARYRIYVPGIGTTFPEIGDNGDIRQALGNIAGWNGQERLAWAMDRLEESIANHAPLVKRINVSIFGFSRGATLARAFAHMLGKACAQRGNKLFWKNAHGKESPLEIYFMGILDTVASVGFGGSRTERIIRNAGKFTSVAGYLLWSYLDKGGHHGWSSDLSIPPYVTQCIHYAAAHECREKFPFDSVLQMQTAPTNAMEVYYPGMHSDVGGGYEIQFQEGRTNDLSRIVLNNLYREAWVAGVPLRSPDEIEKTYPGLFDISPELEACFSEYMRGLTPGSLQHQAIQHMNRYYSWRCGRLRRLADKSLSPPGGIDPYMAITDQEFAEDVQNIAEKKTGYFRFNTEQQEDVIYSEYHRHGAAGYRAKLTPAQQQDFDLLFDKYVHDSIAGFRKQLSSFGFVDKSRYTYTRNMFVGRQNDSYYLWRYKGFLPASAAPEKQAMSKPEDLDINTA